MIFTAFGDMMRVPGAHGSPLEHKARGTDVRIVYSPADALKLARNNPDKHVMFFAIGFETTAPSTALTLMRAKARGHRELLGLLQSRHDYSRRFAPSSIRPTCASMRFIGPGHVSTVIGCRPYEWIARNEGKPIVVSGFEPLDMLQSIVMLLRQLNDGRGEGGEPIQARGAVGRQSRGAEGHGRGLSSCGPISSGAAWDSSRNRRCAFATSYAEWDAEQRFPIPRHARHRSQSRAVRRGSEGRAEARAVQALRQGMHARASRRRADGFFGRLLRRILQLRAPQDRGWQWASHIASVLNGEHELRRAVHAARSASATRKSKWRTAPAAKPAAGLSKACLRRCSVPILDGPLGDAAHVDAQRRIASPSPPTALW